MKCQDCLKNNYEARLFVNDKNYGNICTILFDTLK